MFIEQAMSSTMSVPAVAVGDSSLISSLSSLPKVNTTQTVRYVEVPCDVVNVCTKC